MASYELLKDIRIFLDQHTAEEIPAQSSILEISDKVDPAEAFQTIVDHDFLSAPVYDSSSTEGKIYFGFLDTRNLVAWSVFACDEKNTSPSLEDILTHGIKRASVALSAVSVSCKNNPFLH